MFAFFFIALLNIMLKLPTPPPTQRAAASGIDILTTSSEPEVFQKSKVEAEDFARRDANDRREAHATAQQKCLKETAAKWKQQRYSSGSPLPSLDAILANTSNGSGGDRRQRTLEQKVQLQVHAVAPDVSLLSYADVAPRQFAEILRLKEQYYTVFNQLIDHIKALPFLSWTVESLGKLLLRTNKYPNPLRSAAAPYWSKSLMADIHKQFEELERQMANSASRELIDGGSHETRAHECLRLRGRNAVAAGDASGWVAAVDAMDALLAIKFSDEFQSKLADEARRMTECSKRGAYEMWRKKVDMSNAENAYERQHYLSSLPHRPYSQLMELSYSILKPSEEWQLLALTDVTPKKPATSLSRNKKHRGDPVTSAGKKNTPEDKNKFQLSDKALTLEGLRQLVRYAEEEFDKVVAAAEDLYACAMQTLHALGSLVELGKINPGYMAMAADITERAAPYIAGNK